MIMGRAFANDIRTINFIFSLYDQRIFYKSKNEYILFGHRVKLYYV